MPSCAHAPKTILPEYGVGVVPRQKIRIWFPEKVMEVEKADTTDVYGNSLTNELTLMRYIKFHILSVELIWN